MATIQELCAKASVTAYLEARGVAFIVAGRRRKCRCPLPNHAKDNTPSFYVSTEHDGTELFYCFGCLPASQRVLTVDGMKYVDDIRPGDHVVDLLGVPRRVNWLVEKPIKDPVLKISTSIDKQGTMATAEHTVLWMPRPIRLGDTKLKQGIYATDRVYTKECRHLSSKDWVPVPIPKAGNRSATIAVRRIKRNPSSATTFQIGPEMAFLIGLYCAEGSISGDGLVSFHLHKDETSFVKARLEQALVQEAGFDDVRVVVQKNRRNGGTVTFCHAGIARWLKEACGNGCENKRLPPVMRDSPLDVQASWACGVLWGDGDEGETGLYVTSSHLVDDVFRVALMCGAIPTRRKGRREKGKKEVFGIGFKHNSVRDIWSVSEGRHFIPRVHKDACHVRVKWEGEEGWVLAVRVESVRRLNKQPLKVYDLNVNGSHTFSCLSLGLHNCNQGGNIISLIRMMEGKPNKQVIRELSQRHGMTLDKSQFFQQPAFGADIMKLFVDEDVLMMQISDYVYSFLEANGGSEDALFKVGRLYRKMDELWERGDGNSLRKLFDRFRKVNSQYKGVGRGWE